MRLDGSAPSRSTMMNYLPFEQLLEHNDTAIIQNPLRRIPVDHLTAYIRSFFEEYGLESVVDLTTLNRGAHLARDAEAFTAEGNADGSLTPVEKAALDKEKHLTIWTETRELKIILLTCCVGSILQGWVSRILPLREYVIYHTFNLEIQRVRSGKLTSAFIRLKAPSLAQIRHGRKIFT